MKEKFLIKNILKILALFLLFFNFLNFSFWEFNNKKLDIKIEKVQNKILNLKLNNYNKILIFNIIIKKLEKIENKLSQDKLNNNEKKIEIINYIINKFNSKLKDFKTKNNLINKLNISNEIWKISDLKVFNKEFKIWDKNYFILRKFNQNNISKYLVVEDKTYNTFVINSKDIKIKNNFWKIYNNSEYKEHLDLVYKNRNISKKKYLQNSWLKTWLRKNKNNVYLTVDFCPSSKKWFELDTFNKFMKDWNKNIAISITSAWINSHKKDFQKLIDYNNSWKLNITWVNHTKTHKYNFSNNFSSTFILTPWLILNDELLDVEKKLLEKWQVPSIFMRFPWLISNEKIFKETIYKYWLIPLWSDTWLAKWEKIKSNSIILIHWNKNEPKWIKIFNKILDKKDNKYYYDSINNSIK